MKLSFRKKVGLGGLLLLMASTQLAVSIRRDDWSELLQPSGWLWSIIPAAFMGGWGWITLYFSRAADTRGVHNGLIGLAIAYFATMSYFTFDIILNGNSTSGIAFFLLPVVSTVAMLPLIGLIRILGSKVDGAPID